MPVYSIRWCNRCGKSWGTAYPHAMDCPYCAAELPDVAKNFPHVCSNGHGTTHGGDCMECRTVVKP